MSTPIFICTQVYLYSTHAQCRHRLNVFHFVGLFDFFAGFLVAVVFDCALNENSVALFELADMTLNDVRFMGTENQHVRFTARDRQGRGIQCVLFNRGADYGTMLYAKRSFDLIGHLECQVWQGSKRLQFMTEKIL